MQMHAHAHIHVCIMHIRTHVHTATHMHMHIHIGTHTRHSTLVECVHGAQRCVAASVRALGLRGGKGQRLLCVYCSECSGRKVCGGRGFPLCVRVLKEGGREAGNCQ